MSIWRRIAESPGKGQINVECPHCKKTVEVAPVTADVTVPCPYPECGLEFLISKDLFAPASKPAPTEKPPADARSASSEVESKIRAEFNPINLESPDVGKITSMGDQAVPVLIKMFRHPKTADGLYNQAMLAAALVGFGDRGNWDADQFLRQLAAGKVAILPDWQGDAAMAVAQDYYHRKGGQKGKSDQPARPKHRQWPAEEEVRPAFPLYTIFKKNTGARRHSFFCPRCQKKLSFRPWKLPPGEQTFCRSCDMPVRMVKAFYEDWFCHFFVFWAWVAVMPVAIVIAGNPRKFGEWISNIFFATVGVWFIAGVVGVFLAKFVAFLRDIPPTERARLEDYDRMHRKR